MKYTLAVALIIPTFAIAAPTWWLELEKRKLCGSLGDYVYSIAQKKVAIDKAWFWQKEEKLAELDKDLRKLRRIGYSKEILEEVVKPGTPAEVELRVVDRESHSM